mgnify:CR=1 FL=1
MPAVNVTVGVFRTARRASSMCEESTAYDALGVAFPKNFLPSSCAAMAKTRFRVLIICYVAALFATAVDTQYLRAQVSAELAAVYATETLPLSVVNPPFSLLLRWCRQCDHSPARGLFFFQKLGPAVGRLCGNHHAPGVAVPRCFAVIWHRHGLDAIDGNIMGCDSGAGVFLTCKR